MIEFETKLPKDIIAQKIKIHFVYNNGEDPDIDTEQNKLLLKLVGNSGGCSSNYSWSSSKEESEAKIAIYMYYCLPTECVALGKDANGTFF